MLHDCKMSWLQLADREVIIHACKEKSMKQASDCELNRTSMHMNKQVMTSVSQTTRHNGARCILHRCFSPENSIKKHWYLSFTYACLYSVSSKSKV